MDLYATFFLMGLFRSQTSAKSLEILVTTLAKLVMKIGNEISALIGCQMQSYSLGSDLQLLSIPGGGAQSSFRCNYAHCILISFLRFVDII